jgi:hypothetical protein
MLEVYAERSTVHVSMRLSGKHIRHVRFEVFTAVTMKNGVFWDVTPYKSHTA